MKLKEALSVAGMFAGKTHPLDVVHLREGKVFAWSEISGVELDCDEIDIKLSVSALQLAKAAKQFANPKIKKGKGMTVWVSEGSTRFTLKARLSKSEPPVKTPDGGWQKISAIQVEALKAIAAAIDPNSPQVAFTSMFFGPEWMGAGSMGGVWCLWKGGAMEPISVDPKILSGIGGDTWLARTGHALVLRDQSEQQRWALRLEAQFPHESVVAAIGKSRTQEGVNVVCFSPKSLIKLCRTAAVAMIAPADVLRLVIDGPTLQIIRPHDDSAGFEGGIDVKPYAAGKVEVGINPVHLGKMAALCVEETAEYYLSVGQSTDPIRMWGGSEAMVEAVINPGYLA